MKSHRFLCRSTTLVKPVYSHCAIISPSNALRYPGWSFQPGEPTRNSSSTPTNSSLHPSDAPPPPFQNPDEGPPQEDVEAEKPKRKTRTTTQKDSETLPQLPATLNILWTPEGDQPESSTLPPPELFEEILDNLHVTLHPQTQHKATYSVSGPRVEPTFALYCPIEGGDYIIDETVQELARRTGSDVVVLDAVQLAAGESGVFGKAAAALQLPENPLHFPASSQSSRSSSSSSYDDEDDYYDDYYDRSSPSPSQMTVHLLAPSNSRSSRTLSVSAPAKSPSKAKAFFDEIVNIQAQPGDSAVIHRRPRLIYIRDYLTLAASSSSWYPALLSAVRQRRAGPIVRTSSPIPNPMTIVFGMTPCLTPSAPSPRSRGGPRQSLMNLLMNRQGESTSSSSGKVDKLEWNEDELSDKARERRLRERLRKWETEDSRVVDELPGLMGGESNEEYPSPGQDGQSKTLFIGPQSLTMPLPVLLNNILGRKIGSPPETQLETKFYRTSVLVPSVRSQPLERSCRIERRKEINELTMRMAISSIGGHLPLRMPVDAVERNSETYTPVEESISDEKKMWEDWSKQILAWTVVREIADRAVGSVLDSRTKELTGIAKLSLDATPVPWYAVIHAWTVHRSAKDIKKSWLNSYIDKTVREDSEDGQGAVDEVIERIKESPDLTDHEQRLLACIVDPRSLTSTFEHVHLPPHTVDSVRTIVSLPLLYPAAFQQGILKEYGITGCLLFGPPGTGKTLIVRALAKEADCRMLSIAPSDVMDMYVGEGEKLVKAVFSLARRLSPCVVFIDELDALLGARVGRETGAFSHRGVITEFMSEMDGLKSSKEDRVIVIGATNRPFDLDDAILRRLPRRLLVDLPGENEREEILKIMLRNEDLAPDVDVKVLAKKTDNFSGSDLKNLCVSAAMDAVKVDVVLPWSQKPKEVTSPEETAAVPSEPSLELKTETPTSSMTESQSASPLGGSNLDAAVTKDPTPEEKVALVRVLSLANFTKALKEITPSSSEALGSLGELRKWNDEFGEGRKEKRRQMWGKGNFGFIEKDGTARELKIGAEGDVRFATSNVSGSNP